MSPNGEHGAGPQGILTSAVTSSASLPPMSSFRGGPGVAAIPTNAAQGTPSPAATLQYTHSPGAPAPPPQPSVPLTVAQSVPTQAPGSAEALGKNMSSVVTTRVRLLTMLKFFFTVHCRLNLLFFLSRYILMTKRSLVIIVIQLHQLVHHHL